MLIPPPRAPKLPWLGHGGGAGGDLGHLITRRSARGSDPSPSGCLLDTGFVLKEGSSLTALVEEVLPAVWDLPSPSDPPGPKNLAGITPPSHTYAHIPATGCSSATSCYETCPELILTPSKRWAKVSLLNQAAELP